MALLSKCRGVLTPALLAVLALVAGCAKEEAKWCPYGEGIYCPAGSSCAARQALCIWDACGNGHVDGIEACDDGNKIDGDGCSATCDSTEICGNEKVDEAVQELCDDGNTESGDGCSADCRSIEACGNGRIEDGEDCDGGPGDGLNRAKETLICNTNCKFSSCGDGIHNATAGEGCDGGDPAAPGRRETSDCNSDCTPRVCGDGKKNLTAGEQCDNGTAQNRDDAACLPDCTENICGDGHHYAAREQCDLGPGNSPTGTDFGGACLPGCVNARCGDGNIRIGVELCDAGPDSAADGHYCPYGLTSCEVCNRCQLVAETRLLTGYCGDTTPQAPYEVCDEGAARNGDTRCEWSQDGGTCQICNSTCSGRNTYARPYCGDGTRNGTEVCDSGPDNGRTYCPEGTSCQAFCNDNCNGYVTMQYCGDGDRNGPEACDDGRRNGSRTCEYSSTGTCLVCNSTCTGTEAGTGPRCGDGTTDSNESCDEGDGVNGSRHCPGTGWCEWVCNADCSGKDYGPERCGDGTQNGWEECDNSASIACGTCGASGSEGACRWQGFAPARGRIFINATDIAGMTITLKDGILTREFGFVAATPGAGQVEITGKTAPEIATALAEAINADADLAITATATGNTVDLVNDHPGIAGDQEIRRSNPGTSRITDTEMKGGIGCGEDRDCSDDRDCLSGSCNSSTGQCEAASTQP